MRARPRWGAGGGPGAPAPPSSGSLGCRKSRRPALLCKLLRGAAHACVARPCTATVRIDARVRAIVRVWHIHCCTNSTTTLARLEQLVGQVERDDAGAAAHAAQRVRLDVVPQPEAVDHKRAQRGRRVERAACRDDGVHGARLDALAAAGPRLGDRLAWAALASWCHTGMAASRVSPHP
jgi:hypothetical protein